MNQVEDLGRLLLNPHHDVAVFSVKGRIGRLRFIVYSIMAITIIALLGGYLLRLAESHFPHAVQLGLWVAMALMLIAVVGVWSIKRLHDMNRSGWWAWILAAPGINLLALLWLMIQAGSLGANAYGAEPPPNSKFIENFFGFFCWCVLLAIYLKLN